MLLARVWRQGYVGDSSGGTRLGTAGDSGIQQPTTLVKIQKLLQRGGNPTISMNAVLFEASTKEMGMQLGGRDPSHLFGLFGAIASVYCRCEVISHALMLGISR